MTGRRRLVTALVLAAVAAAPWLAGAQTPAENVRQERLENGLTVIVRENPEIGRAHV